MVLDNDDVKKIEGYKVTYKKVYGFQPLQINWAHYIVDVNFLSDEKHSNHGNDAKEAVARLVRLIRSKYDEKVPIIINADSGFLADENLTYFENELTVKYIVIGKIYSSIYENIKNDGITESDRSTGEHASWVCYDFQSKLDKWDTIRPTILTTLVH